MRCRLCSSLAARATSDSVLLRSAWRCLLDDRRNKRSSSDSACRRWACLIRFWVSRNCRASSDSFFLRSAWRTLCCASRIVRSSSDSFCRRMACRSRFWTSLLWRASCDSFLLQATRREASCAFGNSQADPLETESLWNSSVSSPPDVGRDALVQAEIKIETDARAVSLHISSKGLGSTQKRLPAADEQLCAITYGCNSVRLEVSVSGRITKTAKWNFRYRVTKNYTTIAGEYRVTKGR